MVKQQRLINKCSVLSSAAWATDPVHLCDTAMSVRPRNIALMYIIKT
jgi:hypothetical protein